MAKRKTKGQFIAKISPFKGKDSAGQVRMIGDLFASFIFVPVAGVCPTNRVVHRSLIQDDVDVDNSKLKKYHVKWEQVEDYYDEDNDVYYPQIRFNIIDEISREEYLERWNGEEPGWVKTELMTKEKKEDTTNELDKKVEESAS